MFVVDIKNYINGVWVEHTNSQNIKVTNPANGEQLATIPLSTADDVAKAVAAAKQAQKSWALVPAPKRADYLYAIGQRMKEKKEHLATVLTKEMGKVLEEARGEVQEGIDMAYYMAGEGRRLFGKQHRPN